MTNNLNVISNSISSKVDFWIYQASLISVLRKVLTISSCMQHWIWCNTFTSLLWKAKFFFVLLRYHFRVLEQFVFNGNESLLHPEGVGVSDIWVYSIFLLIICYFITRRRFYWLLWTHYVMMIGFWDSGLSNSYFCSSST